MKKLVDFIKLRNIIGYFNQNLKFAYHTVDKIFGLCNQRISFMRSKMICLDMIWLNKTNILLYLIKFDRISFSTFILLNQVNFFNEDSFFLVNSTRILLVIRVFFRVVIVTRKKMLNMDQLEF